jgi:16S rRNA (guanine527-N7)-methyltransferase
MARDPAPPAELAAALADGACAVGCALDADRQRLLLNYLALLAKWNRVYNLTSIREPRAMLIQHLLDSLAVVEPLRRRIGDAPARLLDVGSGAGLPGVVIATMLPRVDITCIDAVGKKASFVREAAGALGLRNLHVVHGRVEALSAPPFDIVAARAFSSLGELAALTRALLKPGGVWMAMKGREPADELAAVPADIDVFHVEHLDVPGLNAERCLVWMRRRGDASTTGAG